ncbi:MAG: hypothetical protein PHQ43_15725, partial [Dehalococcoidales bacterium]|nr:hypothetical protein [Dehalococcoidales bacterium]
MGISYPVYPDSKNPRSYQSGLEFQDFVVDLLRERLGIVITNYQSQRYQFGVGENKQGIEIKLDRDITGTRNVSIEIAEKTRAANRHWVRSGIYRNDNSWLYIQGNWSIVFIFAKNTLRLLHKSGRYKEHAIPTLKAFLLPVDKPKKYAAKVIELNTGEMKLKRWE